MPTLRGHLQEHPHADLVPLQDLLARLPHVLLPLDVALSAALLQTHTRQEGDKSFVRAWSERKKAKQRVRIALAPFVLNVSSKTKT